jgi:predicted TIM-barrel fold metal-dependent hydrolase
MSARKIDVHCHLNPPFYQEAVIANRGMPQIGRFPDSTVPTVLDLMDNNEIEFSIPAVTYPGVHFMPPDLARDIARRCNDFSADQAAKLPKRFGGFALVPMHDMKHAVAEIDYALDTLKLDGICLFASYGEKFLGDAAFDPVLEALNSHGAVCFIHPTVSPSSRDLDLPYPASLIEYPIDTTRAAVHLLFTGALTRYPRIRFILSHAGGTLPFLAYRLSVLPWLIKRIPQLSREQIYDGLRQFYYDTALSAGRQTMASLETVAAPDRILFGTDFPYTSVEVVADEVKNLLDQEFDPPGQRAAIDRDNALALFPRLRSILRH